MTCFAAAARHANQHLSAKARAQTRSIKPLPLRRRRFDPHNETLHNDLAEVRASLGPVDGATLRARGDGRFKVRFIGLRTGAGFVLEVW